MLDLVFCRARFLLLRCVDLVFLLSFHDFFLSIFAPLKRSCAGCSALSFLYLFIRGGYSDSVALISSAQRARNRRPKQYVLRL